MENEEVESEKNEVAELQNVSIIEEIIQENKNILVSERKKSGTLSVVLILFRRTVVFSFFLLLAYALLFFTGNYQNFLPSNINLILNLTTLVSIILFFASAIAILLTITIAIRSKKPSYLLHLIFFIFTSVFAVGITLFTRSISVLTEGMQF